MKTNLNTPELTAEPKELSIEFVGRGQVSGFFFRQIEKSNKAYIYEVSDTFGNLWYEVFQRRIDSRFGNISYPKANSFGITAWTTKNLDKAINRFTALSE